MITTIAVSLLLLTSYGIYISFGEPSKQLEDPFDNHDD